MTIKPSVIIINATPILVMICLIPLIRNDYILSGIYALMAFATLTAKQDKIDVAIFFVGFFAMTFFEYLFISTGVETFQRNTLFGIMPLWLPFLWGYGYISIKRAVKAIK